MHADTDLERIIEQILQKLEELRVKYPTHELLEFSALLTERTANNELDRKFLKRFRKNDEIYLDMWRNFLAALKTALRELQEAER